MNEQQSVSPMQVPLEIVERLLDGELTLGQSLGLTNDDLYRIAHVGYHLMNMGKLDDAKRIYAGLVAANPYDSVFRCQLGAVHHRLGELDEAVREYTQALCFNIANVDALTGRGMVYLLRKDIVSAFKDFQAVIALDPQGQRESTRSAQQILQMLTQAVSNQPAAQG